YRRGHVADSRRLHRHTSVCGSRSESQPSSAALEVGHAKVETVTPEVFEGLPFLSPSGFKILAARTPANFQVMASLIYQVIGGATAHRDVHDLVAARVM